MPAELLLGTAVSFSSIAPLAKASGGEEEEEEEEVKEGVARQLLKQRSTRQGERGRKRE
jgi:hypothetical protein